MKIKSNIMMKSIDVLEDLIFDMSRDSVYEGKYGVSKPIYSVMSSNSTNQEYTYSEMEAFLLKLSNDPDNYTERTFRYYYQTDITPKPIKPAINRSYFSSLHLVAYLFVEEYKEFYELEEIASIMDDLETLGKIIDPLKIYDYYQYLTNSKSYYIEFAEMLAIKFGMDVSQSYKEMGEKSKDSKLSKSEYNKMKLVIGNLRLEREAELKRYKKLTEELSDDKEIREVFDNFILTMELIIGAKKKLAILKEIKK